MSLQFGKVVGDSTFANATAVYENGFVRITAPNKADRINFYAPADFNYADVYTLNGNQVQISNLTNNQPIMQWITGAPVSGIYDPDTQRLYLNTILGTDELFSNTFVNSTVSVGGGTVAITAPENAEYICFYAASNFNSEDTYTVNGVAAQLKTLAGEDVISGWSTGAPVTLVYHDGILWYNGVGGDGSTYVVHTLASLNPNFKYTRNGTNVKVTANPQVLRDGVTDELSGGVWVMNSQVPQNPADGTVKNWTLQDLSYTYNNDTDVVTLNDISISGFASKVVIKVAEDNVAQNYIFMSKMRDGNTHVGVLMRENVTTATTAYGSAGTEYFGSTLDTFCVNYESHFSGGVKSALKEIKVSVGHGATNTTAKRKIIAPTLMDVEGNGVSLYELGAQFRYFTGGNSYKVATNGTTASPWWLSTDNNQADTTTGRIITAQGNLSTLARTSVAGTRPLLFVDLNSVCEKNADGTYTLLGNEQGEISWEVDNWPEANDLYIRQFTFNTLGQYQTEIGNNGLATEVVTEEQTPPSVIHDYSYVSEYINDTYDVGGYWELESNTTTYAHAYIGYADGVTGKMHFTDATNCLDWSLENGDMEYQNIEVTRDTDNARNYAGRYMTAFLTNEDFDPTVEHDITEFSVNPSAPFSEFVAFSVPTVNSSGGGIDVAICCSDYRYLKFKNEPNPVLNVNISGFYISNTPDFASYQYVDLNNEEQFEQFLAAGGIELHFDSSTFDGYWYVKRELGPYCPVFKCWPAVADWNNFLEGVSVTDYFADGNPNYTSDKNFTFKSGTFAYLNHTYDGNDDFTSHTAPWCHPSRRGRWCRGTTRRTSNGRQTLYGTGAINMPNPVAVTGLTYKTGGGVDPVMTNFIVKGTGHNWLDCNTDEYNGDASLRRPAGTDYGNTQTLIFPLASFAVLDFTHNYNTEL